MGPTQIFAEQRTNTFLHRTDLTEHSEGNHYFYGKMTDVFEVWANDRRRIHSCQGRPSGTDTEETARKDCGLHSKVLWGKRRETGGREEREEMGGKGS